MSDEDKRRFLKVVAGACSAGIATAVGIPIGTAFLDPLRRKAASDRRDPEPYAKLSELAVGVPKKVEVVSSQVDAWDRSERKAIGAIWLVRQADGQVHAFSDVCPHLGCPVGFHAETQVFVSPCHDSAFALADGARLKGPAPRGLDPLPVEIRENTVFVTYQRFVLGIPERKEA